MEPLALTKAALYTPFSLIMEATVLVDQGKIMAAGAAEQVAIPAGFREVPLEGLILAPGFIDQHIHGNGRADVMDGRPQSLAEIARIQATHGVTAFLATTTAASRQSLLQVARAYAELTTENTYKGARCIGLHLEGPYLAPGKAGAHGQANLRWPNLEEVMAVDEMSGHGVKMITMAPELPGAMEVARELRDGGITVSIGHSEATYEAAQAAMMGGFSCATHCFREWPPLEPQQPGALGAVLTKADLPIELIVNGYDLHRAVIELAWKVKGPERFILASNGVPDGSPNSEADPAREVLTLDAAVRNMLAAVDADLADILRMATYNPAKLLGVNKRKGSIYPGKDADIIALTTDLDVVMTMVEGEVISGLISL